MWVDKYRPTRFNELLSHDRTNREMLRWLKAWDACVFNTPARNKPRVFRKDPWAAAKAQVSTHTHPLPLRPAQMTAASAHSLSRTAYLNSRGAGSWITSAPSPKVRSEGVRTCYQTPLLRLIPRPSSAAAVAAPLPSTPLRCAARGADHNDEFRRRFKMNAPSKHGESA